MATIIISVILFSIVGLISFKMISSRINNRKNGCNGSCSGCSHCE